LPKPLRFALGTTRAPSKDETPGPWLSATSYARYLAGDTDDPPNDPGLRDEAIFQPESTVGIGIDPSRGTQDGERIYSARYLRLRRNWSLGCFAKTSEKTPHGPPEDIIPRLFPSTSAAAESRIIIGGQQRICSVQLRAHTSLPLPRGLVSDFACTGLPDETGGAESRHLVKWVLLTPAIWPEIAATSVDGRPMNPHPGGWLPNWIDARNGEVLLRIRSGKLRRDYSGPRHRRHAESERPIAASLVAAMVGKPVAVTGWALPDEVAGRPSGGAKPTYLATPAGSVFYFACKSAEDASHLATALNWHGDDARGGTILRRRSTLLGEKGFGLGVCGTWTPLETANGRPS
jgi:hypothetical protein